MAIRLIESLSHAHLGCKVAEFAPSFFHFGPNSSGAAHAMGRSSGRIVMMPFIGVADAAGLYIADHFADFFSCFNSQG